MREQNEPDTDETNVDQNKNMYEMSISERIKFYKHWIQRLKALQLQIIDEKEWL